MNCVRVLSITVAALALAGCCGAPTLDFILEPREVSIITEPSGAQVVQLRPLQQQDVHLGTSPLKGITVTVMDEVTFGNMVVANTKELLRHSGTLVVRVSKPGYKTYEGVLRTDSKHLVEHRIVLEPEPRKPTGE